MFYSKNLFEQKRLIVLTQKLTSAEKTENRELRRRGHEPNPALKGVRRCGHLDERDGRVGDDGSGLSRFRFPRGRLFGLDFFLRLRLFRENVLPDGEKFVVPATGSFAEVGSAKRSRLTIRFLKLKKFNSVRSVVDVKKLFWRKSRFLQNY